jgi:hypothetical protein
MQAWRETVIVKVVGRDPLGVKAMPASCFSVAGDGLLAACSSGVVFLPGGGPPVVLTSASCFASFCSPSPRVGSQAPLLIDGTRVHVGFRLQRAGAVQWCEVELVSSTWHLPPHPTPHSLCLVTEQKRQKETKQMKKNCRSLRTCTRAHPPASAMPGFAACCAKKIVFEGVNVGEQREFGGMGGVCVRAFS